MNKYILAALAIAYPSVSSAQQTITLTCKGDFIEQQGNPTVLSRQFGTLPREQRAIAIQVSEDTVRQLDGDTFSSSGCRWDDQKVLCSQNLPRSDAFLKVSQGALVNRWTQSVSLSASYFVTETSGFYFAFEGLCERSNGRAF